jgi:hypothetical protein
MTRFCKFCNIDAELPASYLSNTHWTWENKSDRSTGGSHYCAIHRRAAKNSATKTFRDKNHIRYNLSRSINQSLKRKGSHKKGSILSNLSYSMEELKAHLESKFQPGMTWDNYGSNGWEIDHIAPDSSFKYSSMQDETFIKCWSLENLQPLWAKDNRKKYNKIGGNN